MGMAKDQHKNKIVNDEMEAHSLGIYHRQLNIKFPFSNRTCQRWQMDLSKVWYFICVHIPQIRSVICVFRCWADSFRSVLPFPTPSWNINNPRTCVQFSQPHLEPPADPARTVHSSVYCSMYGCGYSVAAASRSADWAVIGRQGDATRVYSLQRLMEIE